jgi:voltage-gated potassium channel Kch
MEQDVERRADRILERIAQRPLKGAWLATALVTLSVTVAAGLLIRVTDPDAFPSLGQGLWWAVQTTTTVGYGDIVPESALGRLIATAVMIVGIGFITVSTAAIASAFVESANRRREREHGSSSPDEADDQMAALRAEVEALRRDIGGLREELAAARRAGGA